MKIHIVGGPGSGKTYLAEKLSRELGSPHYDLDDVQWANEEGYGTKRDAAERDALLNEILADTTGQKIEKIVEDTERDNFMTADEAKAYGLIDEVITRKKDKADKPEKTEKTAKTTKASNSKAKAED